MRDRSPCIYPRMCQTRYPGCQAKCEIGRAYFRRQQEKAEAARAERNREQEFTAFKIDRVHETKKGAGMK